MLVDDNALTGNSTINWNTNNSDTASFLSKIGGEFLFEDQKDGGKEESMMAPISLTTDSHELMRRSRS